MLRKYFTMTQKKKIPCSVCSQYSFLSTQVTPIECMPDHTAMVIFSSSLFGSFIHVHTRVKLVLFVEQILFE